jgi:hypothetical protein
MNGRLRRIAGLALLLEALACSSSKNGNVATSPMNGTGGTSGTTGSGGTAGFTACPIPDMGVRFVGRVDGCDANAVRYAWSGSGFVARFSGTGVTAQLLDRANHHTV